MIKLLEAGCINLRDQSLLPGAPASRNMDVRRMLKYVRVSLDGKQTLISCHPWHGVAP
jgi:hypothetical protein